MNLGWGIWTHPIAWVRGQESPLFWCQLAAGFSIVASELVAMSKSLQGVSLMAFLATTGYMGASLILSLRSYVREKDLALRKTCQLYAIWTVLTCVEAVLIVHWGYQWSRYDTATLILVGTGILSVLRHGKDRVAQNRDIAIFLKCLPVVLAAVKILTTGGAEGIPLLAIVCGHACILIRRLLLKLSAEKNGWDSAKGATQQAEIFNHIAWTLFTIAWLKVHIF